MAEAGAAAASVAAVVVVVVATVVVLCGGVKGSEAAPLYEEGASASQRQGFLALQNKARAEVGVPPLQWSPRLAAYAQWWADRNAALGDCGLHHSHGPYGENIFWGSGRDWSALDAVRDWANEKRWYNYRSNSCDYYDACGHYTQIVWRSSRLVGCARATCANGKIFMTCNYWPPGNYIGQRPY